MNPPSIGRLNLGAFIKIFGNFRNSTEGAAIASKTLEDTTSTALLTGVATVTAAGTPVPLVDSETPVLVDRVILQARKNKTTANTGAVYVGTSDEAADNFLVLLAGDRQELVASNGKKIDLASLYVDAATNDDAVNFIAFP